MRIGLYYLLCEYLEGASVYKNKKQYIVYVTTIKDKYIRVSVFSEQLELHDRTKSIISHF